MTKSTSFIYNSGFISSGPHDLLMFSDIISFLTDSSVISRHFISSSVLFSNIGIDPGCSFVKTLQNWSCRISALSSSPNLKEFGLFLSRSNGDTPLLVRSLLRTYFQNCLDFFYFLLLVPFQNTFSVFLLSFATCFMLPVEMVFDSPCI